MAYVSLGSRSRPLFGSGGGSGSRGGSGGGSSTGMGTSMMAGGRSSSTASSDMMKPPPGDYWFSEIMQAFMAELLLPPSFISIAAKADYAAMQSSENL